MPTNDTISIAILSALKGYESLKMSIYAHKAVIYTQIVEYSSGARVVNFAMIAIPIILSMVQNAAGIALAIIL